MDFLGTAMGFVTIPMAFLSMASVVGALVLVAEGRWRIVVAGAIAGAGGLGAAWLLEKIATALDAAAWTAQRQSGRATGRTIAMAGAALPLLVIIAWEYLSLHSVMAGPGNPMALWLWSYGVATAPWTVFALRVGSDRRTLCGIRAYAGHLAYWLLSLAILAFDSRPVLAMAVMAVPAVLPFVVGTLLASADRDALRNVRI